MISSEMGFEKFNQHAGSGAYLERYLERDGEFYGAIRNHIGRLIGEKPTVGLDLGAGPGVGALIMESLDSPTRLIGAEPSLTHSDGAALSEQFLEEGGLVHYEARHQGIVEVSNDELPELDYLLALRSSHEMAESIGGKDQLFEELGRIIEQLKQGGFLVVAEPQYSSIPADEVIAEIQRYQMSTIRHSHVPSDYITDREMEADLKALGLKLENETIIPNRKLLAHLKNAIGYASDESPCSFYVQTYRLRALATLES